MIVALHIGGGASQYNHRSTDMGHLKGYIPGMISRHLLIFIAPFMFFIYHDKSQVWLRSKDSASRAYYNCEFTALYPAPLVISLTGGKPTVNYGNPSRETR